MRKIYFAIFCVFCLAAATKAQALKLGFGPEVSIPSGNASNVSSFGFGGFLKLEQPIATKFSITGTAESTTFLGKKFLGIRGQNLSYIPVKLGLKYYPSEGFYAEGQCGAAFPVSGDKQTKFTWALGVGSFINRRSSIGQFDFGLRFQGITNAGPQQLSGKNSANFGYIALHVGYVLAL